jgi:hypothetical protein
MENSNTRQVEIKMNDLVLLHEKMGYISTRLDCLPLRHLQEQLSGCSFFFCTPSPFLLFPGQTLLLNPCGFLYI